MRKNISCEVSLFVLVSEETIELSIRVWQTIPLYIFTGKQGRQNLLLQGTKAILLPIESVSTFLSLLTI